MKPYINHLLSNAISANIGEVREKILSSITENYKELMVVK